MISIFAPVLFVVTVAWVGFPIVQGNDKCSLYRHVNNKHEQCIREAGLFKTKYGSSASTMIDVYNNSCKNLSSYTSCMEQYSKNCANKEAIMAEVRAHGVTCNGQVVADWFKNNIAPVFDKITKECMRTVSANPTCNAALRPRVIYPEFYATTGEGVRFTKGWMDVYFDCFKEDAKLLVPGAPICSGISWQEVFIFAVSDIYLGGSEIFGCVLSNSQLNYLKNLALAGQ